MSRFHNNRGGMGMMNNFMPRRGSGPGGPMRGGFMGNQHFRNHPFQNQNQNRRGGSNFNRSGNQGPQKPQQNQPSAPVPGPALTMKAQVKDEKPVEEQPKQTTPAPTTPKIPPTPPKPIVTSPPPSQVNNQLKSPPANVNGQQPPQPSPKPAPQQQQTQKPAPPQQQQTQKPAPPPQQQQTQKPAPPQQQQTQKPAPQQQAQKLTPPQVQKPPQQQALKTPPQQPPKPPQQQNQGNQQHGQRPGPQQGQGPQRPQQQGPRQGHHHQQGQRPGFQQRGGSQQYQRPQQNQRPPMAKASKARAEQEQPTTMGTGEDRPKAEFKLSMLLKPGEKTYTQRCRLFVGNMPNDITEEEFKRMFAKYGEPSEVFVNKAKGFGFIRLESRALAEIAKAELDDTLVKGRTLRVRFATHSAALSVKNLSPFVSNELLEDAFLQFGMVERAIVIVDDRGRSTGKGIVEFASKPAARKALDRCNDGVFLLTSSPRPVIVEPLEQFDDEDGLPEKLAQKNPRYQSERDQPPRFAHPGSFEFEYSKRWKSLDEMEKQQRQQVEKNMQEAREKLESEMEDAYHEHQAHLLRQDLLRRQEELRRMEELHSQEMQKRKEMQLRQEEERRRREEEVLRKREMEEQMRRQREENYRMGNFMDRERDMRMSSGGAIGMADMSFGTPNQKFGLSGMKFEGQQGIGGSPGMMNNDMRSERFAQGGRGMGPGNSGFGRVREEFDGPTKKPRF